MPTIETIAAGSWAWIAHTFAINPILMLIFAGSLHLYLFTFAKQGMKPKFDPKSVRKRPTFALGEQVLDNMF